MPRVVVRYLTGSRANEADVLPGDSGEGWIAGRDQIASILFDPEQDDLVSRQHLKITQDPNNPATFRLVDLQSRNGTFVNGKRVYGSTFLNHNDRVQLGPSGPEFQFELDPPPAFAAAAMSTSGMISDFNATGVRTPPLTRETFSGYTPDFAAAGPSRPIGRATVERMLDDTFGLLKQESTKGVIVGLLSIAAVLIVGVGTWMYMRKSAMETVAAQRESQFRIEQAAIEMRKAGEDTRERQAEDAERFKQEMKESNESQKKTLQSLSSAITTIRKTQTAQISQQKQGSIPENGARGPAGANGPTVPGQLTFSQLMDQVDELLAQNKYAEAGAMADQMIRLDGGRYEGYFFGGVSALELKQNARARELLTRSLTKAPLDKQHQIQELLAETARK